MEVKTNRKGETKVKLTKPEIASIEKALSNVVMVGKHTQEAMQVAANKAKEALEHLLSFVKPGLPDGRQGDDQGLPY